MNVSAYRTLLCNQVKCYCKSPVSLVTANASRAVQYFCSSWLLITVQLWAEQVKSWSLELVDEYSRVQSFQNPTTKQSVFLNRLSGVRLSPGPPSPPLLDFLCPLAHTQCRRRDKGDFLTRYIFQCFLSFVPTANAPGGAKPRSRKELRAAHIGKSLALP
jgi:hypothetical protein